MRRREPERRGDVGARVGERLPRQRVHEIQVHVAEDLDRGALPRRAPHRRRARVRAPRESAGRSSARPATSRLTPAALNAANFARSNVPGLASSVTSASGSSGNARAHAGEDGVDRFGRKKARRAAADEHADDAPAPDRRQREFEVAHQRRDIARLGNVAAALVRIEIAVGAFLEAPRNVDVQRERRQRLESRLAEGRIE